MTIFTQRTVQEISPIQSLEKQVAEKAEVVQSWANTIAKITTEFNTATLARDNAKKARETHALKAAMGDTHAVSEIKHARAAQTAAELTIADLAVALPAAEAELATAEKAAASARRALAMLMAEKVMRDRVIAAAEMDAGFAAAAAAYEKYERLGRELLTFEDLNLQQGGTMGFYESAIGYRRIAAALPAFFVKLFPTTWSNSDPRRPLAESELHFWQLPPEKHSQTKAA
jgi:hypothetical protein